MLADPIPTLSPLRARLASFDHAYKIALCLRRTTGRLHYVVRTSDPLQPHRVTDTIPPRPDRTLALIA